MTRRVLPDLTIVMTDGLYHALSRVALDSVLAVIEPREVLIFGPRNFGPPGARHIKADIRSEQDALTLLHTDVPREVTTSHYLYLHWDAGVRNPGLWSNDFLRYDYIGAPWPWHPAGTDVGNGGFSIRSKRLGTIMADLPFVYREDDHICRTRRKELEQAHGIRFAPRALAERFSVEHGDWTAFGFHGLWNFARLYSEFDLIRYLSLLPQGFNRDRPDVQMLIQCCQSKGYASALRMLSPPLRLVR